MLSVAIVVALFVAASAQYPQGSPGQQLTTPGPRNYHPPAPVHYVSIGDQLQGDYKFGYDTGKGPLGQSFREESRLPDGTIKGQYGILDASGQQRIIKYTAGKFGFQAEGDGVPIPAPNPEPQAAAQGSVPSYQSPAQPQYRPQFSQPPQVQYPQPAPQPQQYQPPPQQYQAPPQYSQPAPARFPQSVGLPGATPTPDYDHQKHYLQYQLPENQQAQRTQGVQSYFDSSLLSYDIGNQQRRSPQGK